MQLTGRTLVLALGACLVSGAAFGLVTSIAGDAPRPPTPAESDTRAPASHSENLGDEVNTFPLDPSPPPDARITDPTASPLAAESATATAIPTREPTPESTVAPSTPTRSPEAVTTPEAHPQPSSAQPTPGVRITTRATRPPRDTARPTHTPARGPKPSVSPAATRPLDGWHPPALHVGANDIAPPRLSSGADVGIVIGCSPAAECSVHRSTLVLSPSTLSVSVTWSAPGSRGFTSWSDEALWTAP
jgi:hypothetical protein